jgi:hypothetical protein
MENPISAVKSAFSLGLIIRTFVVMVVIFAIADFFGKSGYLVNPYNTFLNRNA